jgi:RIO kinase 1
VSLEQLLEDGVIDEVLARLKSGKEADVWLVRHHGEVLCAKVYKNREFRSFKNNAAYKEGRAVRNTRTQRAMNRGSRFGQAAAEEAWKSAESDALHRLYAEGVRVPEPVLFYEGILLMKLVVDAEGHPAPRLIDAHFVADQAAALYADLRGQATRMLGCDLIHGDLSPYNVLLGAAGPTIIDFPQVVSAAHNSTAQSFFTRDLENLRKFFAGFAPALQARAGDAAEIWRAYVRRELTADFVPSGRLPPQERPHDQRRHGRPQHPRAQHPQPQQPQHQQPQHPRHQRPQHPQHPRPQHPKPSQSQQARPQPQHHPPPHPKPSQPRQARPHQKQHPRPQNPGIQQPRPAPHERAPAPHARPLAPSSHRPPSRAPQPARPARHQRREVPQERLPPQVGRARPPRTARQSAEERKPPADPGKRPR